MKNKCKHRKVKIVSAKIFNTFFNAYHDGFKVIVICDLDGTECNDTGDGCNQI